MPTGGFVEVVDVLPAIQADRTNLGVRMADWLRSDQPALGLHPGVEFAGHPTAPPTTGEGSPGRVLLQTVALRDGRAQARVRMTREAAVMLKTSFDPRWQVTVDGEPADPFMIAPSFVAVLVPPGEHRVSFTYEPFPRYDVMLLVGALALGLLFAGPSYLRRRRDHATAREPAGDGPRATGLGDPTGSEGA
jgi:hypothetical protein